MKKYLKIAFYLSIAVAFCSASAGPATDFFRSVKRDDGGEITSLIRKGFDPNSRDEAGQTGLVLAIRDDAPRVVQALVSATRTDVNAPNAKDETPLMMAALRNRLELASLLIKKDAAVNKTGWAPLHYAATGGHAEMIRLLLEHHAFIDAGSPNGSTPLMMAAMYGSTDAVKLLLAEGADPTMRNDLGLTAADFAQRGQRPDAIAILTPLAGPSAAKPGVQLNGADLTPAPAPAALKRNGNW